MEANLESIETPAALRRLELEQLTGVANELRNFLIDTVSQTGGHFGSNLGTVELAIALHYVFDTPHDRIIWDVGHQAYPHKILTGRREAMRTLRQTGGLSGFPQRDESEYDAFGTAHSSTSISAALGMAHGARLAGSDRHSVAVIGDGALTAGMAFEALNNAALCRNLRLLIILNDNDMSISHPAGALRDHLRSLTNAYRSAAVEFATHRAANSDRERSEMALYAPAEAIRGDKASGTIFEALGLSYTGPIDGHDLSELVPALRKLRGAKGAQVLHVVTRKGRGYAPAEANPVLYHGPGRFDPSVGVVSSKPGKPTWTQIFGEWLCDEARQDVRVVAVTPAMCEGSGLTDFSQCFPERYFDVGIAEQHAVTFAGGLAAEGLRPVVAIYSTFLQRAYDQVIHDIALQRLPVVFAIDRAGVVGADGPSHMGAFDMACLRCVPNLVVMAPADENECRQMLHTALLHDGPTAVRYPRGKGPGVFPDRDLTALPIGKAEIRRRMSRHARARIALLAFGSMVSPALAAGKRLDATVVNMRFVKPLDEDLVRNLAQAHDILVTIEEGCIAGGAGAACLECLAAAGLTPPVLQLGFEDTFIEHGDPEKLLAAYGLDERGIEAAVRRFVREAEKVSIERGHCTGLVTLCAGIRLPAGKLR
ncbi:1-deoxy-D-xylulose-5-phosphate synthase [Burkholderia ubonensis]|uniref:1-deoxy-D-xylulose-5-phosphate synthase n=1 Tax=Burkholderia ubonensis TaxID=101571 RepID=UPI00075503FE|nr:1-deoxy-D-xylulose-5-phosphate synthase [Burkholderia ubonensis]KWN69693.1 1-deoxy-D-xylulose-5-phosphate synthase [Burkholderia ubonensis]